jgi:hypothetical protein
VNLTDCAAELQQEIAARAEATSAFTETAFADVVTSYLADSGAIDGFESCTYKHRGMRIDGFFFNVEDEATLDLFIVDYRGQEATETLTKTEAEQHFKRAEAFFEKSCGARFVDGMEASHPAYSLALAILEQNERIRRVRLMLLTDAALSDRVKAIPPRHEGEREWTYRIWDINSLCSLLNTGEPEEIVVDFQEMFGRPLACLPANQGTEAVTSYLAVIPGAWLSAIYDQYGGRLLEKNVRTFLQTRGKVNKGIQKTILEDPDMFFAFNNGISATAAEATVDVTKGIGHISRLRRLQIVNGGQTTASIFNVTKRFKDARLDGIFVQMKLSVIGEQLVDEVVPKISEYANTQNRISDADLFSNHPFHIRLEGIASRVLAPAVGGSQLQTHWFYERARGQYLNQQTYLTRAKKAEFQLRNPRGQVITKTDLAKVINTFERKPDVVSKGAQKNFAEFATFVGGRDAWKTKQESINDTWYKDAVAKTIIFHTAEKIVQEAPWYSQGYRANVVTYTIALIVESHALARREINYERIWQRQAIGDGLRSEISRVGEKVLELIVITASQNGVSNVTEWCKRQACWTGLKAAVKVNLLPDSELVSAEEAADSRRAGKSERKITNEAEAQIHVVGRTAAYWKRMLDWGENTLVATPTDLEFLRLASQLSSRKVPTGPQSLRLIQIEEKAIAEGFRSN